MSKDSAIILADGVSFADWESDLQAALIKKGRLAHVFHNLDEIKPAIKPRPPVPHEKKSAEVFDKLSAEYEENLARWKEGEIEARNVLLRRLSPSVRPQNFRKMSAKQIFDNIAATREEGAATPYETAVRDLINTKFTTIEDYCNNFMQHYLSVNSAAESMVPHDASSDSDNPYLVPHEFASLLFVLGTEDVDWLETWRQTKIVDGKNRYSSLENMMSTLRQVGKSKSKSSSGQICVATGSEKSGEGKERKKATGGPNDFCTLCWHRHKNKHCYKQHPERKSSKAKGQKGKGSKRASIRIAAEDSGSESEGDQISVCKLARAASASLMKNPLLYDTGASHHFVRCKSDFVSLRKLHKPFKFDQAVGASTLTYQGTSRIAIGNQTFELRDSLYSPKSSCMIISAGRLKEQHGLVAANGNELLIQIKDKKPVARLESIDHVLYIKLLATVEKFGCTKNIAAPGAHPTIVLDLDRIVPHVTNAHLWHQRLGHTGQQILKKTAQCSLGMTGIDYSEFTTCETCHLSKAQRFVSREPRPTPGEPLDEVFVDTVGKLAVAFNAHQYAVILTDAKTRMRWVITTATKDEIATQLIKWIEYQYHQYGKRVRIVFRDSGTEFNRIKNYCDEHGIRTDTSAPYTPEQNGAAEASNKVILRKARSMLLDARMPPCFWPWAVEHAVFITNRLYCLRTKSVPIVDFLRGLKQPHHEKVDFSCLPRFGCRAYKLIDPKPGKFKARAEKGWFVGFPKNTSKNFLIYHTRLTTKSGWKWIESCSPHVTFNEDVMFGDMLNTFDKQKTINYWARQNPLPVEEISASISQYPRSYQTVNGFEGERLSSSPERQAVSSSSLSVHPKETELATREVSGQLSEEPHTVPIVTVENSPSHPVAPPELPPQALESLSNHQRSQPEKHGMIGAPPTEPQIEPPAVPEILEEQWPRQPIEKDNLTGSSSSSPNQPNHVDEFSDYESEYLSPTPSEQSDHLDLTESFGDDDYSQNEQLVTQTHDIVYEQPDQGELDSSHSPAELEQEVYDQVMTGWTEIPPIAGQKRLHSPEPEMIRSKRGRPVKKVDYYKLHHGKAVVSNSDPKTWSEAMSSREAEHWRLAANEECRSLKETGAIQMIKRSQLPKGRTPMKCKWVFKKNFLADGSLDKYKARCTVKGFTQHAGIYFKETFAPTPRADTGRILLALAHRFGWHRRQGDVPAAFLNPDL
ncbi:hypothetical protein K3495_g13218, partial [Podosphaera aphanis]